VVEFKYVEITIINQNSTHAQIKSRSVTELMLPFGPEPCSPICSTEQ